MDNNIDYSDLLYKINMFLPVEPHLLFEFEKYVENQNLGALVKFIEQYQESIERFMPRHGTITGFAAHCISSEINGASKNVIGLRKQSWSLEVYNKYHSNGQKC